MNSLRTSIPALALALLAASCGGGRGSDSAEPGASASPTGDVVAQECPRNYQGLQVYPIFVSSEVTTREPSRFLLGLLSGENDAPVAAPGVDVEIAFRHIEGDAELAPREMEFIWTVKPERGLYLTEADFTEQGVWAADLSVSGGGFDEQVTGCFEVRKTGTTPVVGDKVPASKTATADDVDSLEEISTDPHPVPRFYETSVAEAIERGQPFVLVFATPKFCASAVCGPTLDDVERVAKDYPGITFIHSEIYEGLDPKNPVLPAVEEWGLPSEPWVFVVDGSGHLVAKFEGAAPEQDLRAVLDRLR